MHGTYSLCTGPGRERDAAALWRRGGRRPRPIPDDSDAGRAAAELMSRLRSGQQERRTWLLDTSTDIDVPVVAAVSAGPDGFGLCVGLSARLTLPEAVTAAIFELCQVELGQHVVAAKLRESGGAALNDSDHRQLRRGTRFDTGACALLRPEGVPRPLGPAIPSDPATALPLLVERLAAFGAAVYRLDLTREMFGVPVVRVLAPWLQLEPCDIAGAPAGARDPRDRRRNGAHRRPAAAVVPLSAAGYRAAARAAGARRAQ